MDVVFKKQFMKEYGKLTSGQKIRVEETILCFREDPFHPLLKNHALHGDLIGRRAISAGGDLRLIFYADDHYEKTVFLRIGSHEQVY